MTPQEKAKELVDKMVGSCCMCEADAEHSAIVAVDEMLDLLKQLNSGAENTSSYKFLESVKQEIEKL